MGETSPPVYIALTLNFRPTGIFEYTPDDIVDDRRNEGNGEVLSRLDNPTVLSRRFKP